MPVRSVEEEPGMDGGRDENERDISRTIFPGMGAIKWGGNIPRAGRRMKLTAAELRAYEQ